MRLFCDYVVTEEGATQDSRKPMAYTDDRPKGYNEDDSYWRKEAFMADARRSDGQSFLSYILIAVILILTGVAVL